MIQEVTEHLVSVNDTISLAVKDLFLNGQGNSNVSDLKYLWMALASIVSSIIGAFLTLWYKQKEFSNFKENLLLQKDLLKEAKTNNENQIKAELVRLQDLRNQYKLSLKKFDFEKISKILDLSKDKDEKVQMIKTFHAVLEKLGIDNTIMAPDVEGYRDFSIRNIYQHLDEIVQEIKQIHKQFPNVFVGIQEELFSVAQTAENINYEAGEVADFNNMDEEELYNHFEDSLLQIQVDLNEIYRKMIDEFKMEENLKKGLISTDNL